MAENCLKSVSEEGDVMDEVATGEDQAQAFSDLEAPTLEIDEVLLSELSEEDQLEVALSPLDADYQQGTATITSGPASQEDQQYGLQDQPDPAYIQVLQPSSPSLSTPPLSADIYALADISATVEPLQTYDNADNYVPADGDDCGDTIIPSNPIVMDATDWEKTKEYPVPTQILVDNIEAFNASPWRQKYEDALIDHLKAIQIHLSGVTPNSAWPKPPSFKEYFDRFIAELSKDEDSAKE